MGFKWNFHFMRSKATALGTFGHVPEAKQSSVISLTVRGPKCDLLPRNGGLFKNKTKTSLLILNFYYLRCY